MTSRSERYENPSFQVARRATREIRANDCANDCASERFRDRVCTRAFRAKVNRSKVKPAAAQV